MTPTQSEVSEARIPAAFAARWFWQPQIWQQQVYQLAYARAWAALYGPQPVRVRPADLPRVLRN